MRSRCITRWSWLEIDCDGCKTKSGLVEAGAGMACCRRVGSCGAGAGALNPDVVDGGGGMPYGNNR